MAYIRWGAELKDGSSSKSFVIGDGDRLVNLSDNGGSIPYGELKRLFKEEADDYVRKQLKERLALNEGELEIVCELLFKERDKGEWN